MFGRLRQPKGPQLSEGDVRAIVKQALPDVEQSLGQSVFQTTDGAALVTQSEIIKSLSTALETETRNLTGESLAAQLGVPGTVIQRLLPQAASGFHGAYIDNLLILPKPRVSQLVDQFAAGGDSILRVHDLCSQEKLTIKSLEYIVRHSGGQLVLAGQGEYLVSASTLQRHVDRVNEALNGASKPVKFSEIEPDAVLRELVMSTLGLSGETYTPPSYVAAQSDAAIAAMSKAGYISNSDLAALDIKDAAKFAKQQCAVLLKNYVVSSAFYSEQRSNVEAALQKNGYYDLRDIPLGRVLSDALINDEKTKLAKYWKREAYSNHLVRPSLERDLTAKISAALEPDAREAAQALDFEPSGAVTADALLNKIKLPSAADISTRFLTEFPDDLPLGARIAPQIRSSFAATALTTLRQRVESAVSRLDAKILMYLNGLESIKNPELKSLVWDEWQQYVSDNQYSVPGNVNEARIQFKGSDELLAEVTSDTLTLTQARLQKLQRPKDAALILHLAAVVYHANHEVPGKNGVLKFRGKLLPKLLKEFEFPPSFTELRKAVKSEPAVELLEKVKHDALE